MMIYIYAFLFAGFVCAIGQIIIDNTKLTAGHVTSLFTVVGAFLSFINVYPWLLKKCGGGATTLIMNFGHNLYTAAFEGFKSEGWLGIFSQMLSKSSVAIVSVIVFSFVLAIIFKPKN